MRDPLATVAEYHDRAVRNGNDWAQMLARKLTYGLTPGAPNERNASMPDHDQPQPGPERLSEWVPRVGEPAIHQAWGESAKRVEVLELDGRFTKVREIVEFLGNEAAAGEVRWVLTTDLRPLGRA